MASPMITSPATLTSTTHTSLSVFDATSDQANHCQELSCALIQDIFDVNEITILAAPDSFATILDSGVTSHLIKGQGYFVDFELEDHPPM